MTMETSSDGPDSEGCSAPSTGGGATAAAGEGSKKTKFVRPGEADRIDSYQPYCCCGKVVYECDSAIY